MRANSSCMSCLLGKQEERIARETDEAKKTSFIHEVLGVLYEYGEKKPAPWITCKVNDLYQKYFGKLEDYTELKHKFNQLLLAEENRITDQIRKAEDPIKACIQYVCAGNYIDFGVIPDVKEEKLRELLDQSADFFIPEEEYRCLKDDLSLAKELVYLTDNCGEVVLDKIFIRFIKEVYPNIHVTAVLRETNTQNDATLEDAKEIGLDQVCDCRGNGCVSMPVPGTALEEIDPDTRELLVQADIIISKGQGNFECIYGTELRPYYMFLCKCELFMRRFQLPQFTSVFIREDHIQATF